MQQARSMPFASRKRSTFSGEERISFASAWEGSSIRASTSALTIDHGWMCRWTSKIFMAVMALGSRLSGPLPLERSCRRAGPRAESRQPTAASRQHHQPHADRAGRTGILKLARAEELRVNLIAIDDLESALPEVLLGRRGEQIELAQTARGEPIEQLPHDAPAQPEAAVLRIDGNRTDQRRVLIGLGAAA